MLKVLSILTGLLLIAVGILGFLPDYVTDGKLFGTFGVNFTHNVVVIIAGIIALLCGLTSNMAAKALFIIYGLLSLALAILWYYQKDHYLNKAMAINDADTFLHIGMAVVFLFFGLFIKSK